VILLAFASSSSHCLCSTTSFYFSICRCFFASSSIAFLFHSSSSRDLCLCSFTSLYERSFSSISLCCLCASSNRFLFSSRSLLSISSFFLCFVASSTSFFFCYSSFHLCSSSYFLNFSCSKLVIACKTLFNFKSTSEEKVSNWEEFFAWYFGEARPTEFFLTTPFDIDLWLQSLVALMVSSPFFSPLLHSYLGFS